jgi:hypothetical protein
MIVQSINQSNDQLADGLMDPSITTMMDEWIDRLLE